MSYIGYIDRIGGSRIEGWVANDAHPCRSVMVFAEVGGRRVAEVLADQARPDVAVQFGIDPGCGFIIDLAGVDVPAGDIDITLGVASAGAGDAEWLFPGSPFRLLAADRQCLYGNVDQVHGPVIKGWAVDPATPSQPVVLRATVDGVEIGQIVADLARADLKIHFGQHSDRAFEIRVPPRWCDGCVHVIRIESSASGIALPGTPFSFCAFAGGLQQVVDLLAHLDTSMSTRTAAANALSALVVRFEREAPGSVSFDDYPSWFDLFMRAPTAHRDLADDGPPGPAIFVVVAAESDLDEAIVALQSVLKGGPAKMSVALGVDPGVWSLASPEQQSAIATLVGPNLWPLAETGPSEVARRLSDPAATLVLWLEPGARLFPGSLAALSAAAAAGADVVYGDWETRTPNGGRLPHLLPDWNPEYFLGVDYVGPVCALRGSALRSTGALAIRPIMSGAGQTEMSSPGLSWTIVRSHLLAVSGARSGGVVHVARILGSARRPLLQGLPIPALSAHLAAHGMAAAVRPHPAVLGTWSVQFPLPAAAPLVSMIIPTRDRADLLEVCLHSLLARTAYPTFEIIVIDNGSIEPATHALLRAAVMDERIRVIRDERPFNYSALNNAAARLARGTVLGFINNDIELPADLDIAWLHRVVGRLAVASIGGVGLKLIYPTGMVQHAGVVLGIGGFAENAFKHLRVGELGYGGRAALAQTVSAATAAALFVRRSTFDAVGGFDEDQFAVVFSDVDLCLRIGERGERIVIDPEIVWLHRESASRSSHLIAENAGREFRERMALQRRWAKQINADPQYNIGLNLDNLPYLGLAFPPRGWRSD